mmetsp:Transcript_53510/g.148367  ORF Transcript_53510/g.148367 Transcript_53510/m.148367 type:complete len:629 (+) Transcript_53510:26-1912(+)
MNALLLLVVIAVAELALRSPPHDYSLRCHLEDTADDPDGCGVHEGHAHGLAGGQKEGSRPGPLRRGPRGGGGGPGGLRGRHAHLRPASNHALRKHEHEVQQRRPHAGVHAALHPVLAPRVDVDQEGAGPCGQEEHAQHGAYHVGVLRHAERVHNAHPAAGLRLLRASRPATEAAGRQEAEEEMHDDVLQREDEGARQDARERPRGIRAAHIPEQQQAADDARDAQEGEEHGNRPQGAGEQQPGAAPAGVGVQVLLLPGLRAGPLQPRHAHGDDAVHQQAVHRHVAEGLRPELHLAVWVRRVQGAQPRGRDEDAEGGAQALRGGGRLGGPAEQGGAAARQVVSVTGHQQDQVDKEELDGEVDHARDRRRDVYGPAVQPDVEGLVHEGAPRDHDENANVLDERCDHAAARKEVAGQGAGAFSDIRLCWRSSRREDLEGHGEHPRGHRSQRRRAAPPLRHAVLGRAGGLRELLRAQLRRDDEHANHRQHVCQDGDLLQGGLQRPLLDAAELVAGPGDQPEQVDDKVLDHERDQATDRRRHPGERDCRGGLRGCRRLFEPVGCQLQAADAAGARVLRRRRLLRPGRLHLQEADAAIAHLVVFINGVAKCAAVQLEPDPGHCACGVEARDGLR